MRKHAILQMDVKTGVVEVEIREDDVQERFCTLQLRLKSFDVLRRRIATTIGRLIVCALYVNAASVIDLVQH